MEKGKKINLGYILLGLFVLYFNEIIILNEKFLVLLIFLGFVGYVHKNFSSELSSFFGNLRKELVNEIFLYEYNIDAKYSYIYYYLNLDLLRKKLFYRIYKFYLKGLNLLIILYYNFSFKNENYLLLTNFENLVNEVYYFIMKKHLYIKLNFLYRSYYYVFSKFKAI